MTVRRVFGRVGLFWQLLIPAALAVVLSVATVQAWTFNINQGALEKRMQANLTVNLALLKAYLAPLGTEWSSEGGQLRLGFSPIAGHSDVEDAAAIAAGGEATIFSGTTPADAAHSGQVVRDAVAAMSAIEQSAHQITQIIGVIDETSFQTNLLARGPIGQQGSVS